MKKTILLSALSIGLLIGCGGSKETPAPEPSQKTPTTIEENAKQEPMESSKPDSVMPTKTAQELIMGKWTLATWRKKDSVAQNETTPWLWLMEGHTYQGFSGCNNFSGKFSYTEEDDLFNLQPGPMTKKACLEDNPEMKFMEMVEKMTKVKLEGDKLSVYGQGLLLGTFVRTE